MGNALRTGAPGSACAYGCSPALSGHGTTGWRTREARWGLAWRVPYKAIRTYPVVSKRAMRELDSLLESDLCPDRFLIQRTQLYANLNKPE